MSIFDFFKRKESRNWETTKQLTSRLNGIESGVTVNTETAKQVSAFSACVKVISEDIAALPFFVYERLENGDRAQAREHPAYKLLHDQPNDWHPSNTFRKLLTRWVLLYGNGYAYITKQGSQPVRLQPVHPSLVTPTIDQQGNLYYVIKVNDKDEQVSPEFVLHIMGLSDDGIVGLSPVEEAAAQLGIALAADKLASSFYGSGSQLGGLLVHPGKLSPEAEANLARSWRENYSGTQNANKTAVLQEGIQYTPLGVPPEQAQFLESRKWQLEEIARWFRMPPHKIGHLEKATFSNIEHLGIDYVQSTLLNWLIAWEQEVNRKLFLSDEQSTFYAEHKVDALLRGDIASRYAAHALAIQWGWQTPKRVAQIENLPTEGLSDVPVTPLNMSPVSEESEDQRQVNNLSETHDTRIAPLVLDACRRLLTKESKAFQRASKKQESEEELEQWLSEFYTQHKATVLRAYAPIVDTFCNDKTQTLDTLAATHLAGSMEAARDGKSFKDEASLLLLASRITEQIVARINE